LDVSPRNSPWFRLDQPVTALDQFLEAPHEARGWGAVNRFMIEDERDT
jgi:hypothetical protein